MSNLDVRSNLQWSTATTIKSWHRFHSTETQNCQILTHLCGCNSVRVRVYLYDCGHHWKWKVLHHFIYVQYGCEKNLTVVCSLNHDMMASLPLNSDPHFISVTRVHLYDCRQCWKVIKHCVCVSNLDARSNLQWSTAPDTTWWHHFH